MSVTQIAEILGCSRQAVYRALWRGWITHKRCRYVGNGDKHYLINEADARRFIQWYARFRYGIRVTLS